MKKNHYKLIMSFLLLINSGMSYAQNPAQSWCGADELLINNTELLKQSGTVYTGSVDPAYLATFPPISFNLHFWIINRSDGSNDYPVSYNDILQNVKRVNYLYRNSGICFVLSGYGYINDTSKYEHCNIYGFSTSMLKNNAINVIVPKTLAGSGIGPNGVASTGDNKLGVNISVTKGLYEEQPGDSLAHELGHIFSLIHTWGGATTGQTNEHVTRDVSSPQYNALSAGDFVHDTSATSSYWIEANNNHVSIFQIVDASNCTYIGTGTDELGVPFQLTTADVGNIMQYTYGACYSNFTTGQFIRMREFIDSPSNSSYRFMQAKRSTYKAVDLFMKDSAEDVGNEPNTESATIWGSPSVWVTHNPDSNTEHQNPEYHPTHPNYVHVRIGNRGCGSSSGNDKLKVYWSKAATSLAWDYHWVGNTFSTGALMGNLIGSIDIPALNPNEEIVLTLPWNSIPDPSIYQSINAEPWHFCLLARIESADDPMTFAEQQSIGYNIVNNNNIIQKNITIVDLEPNTNNRPIGGVIAVGNVFDHPRTFSLEFKMDENEKGKSIFDEAEVTVTLDDILMNALLKGDLAADNIKQIDKNKFLITGNNAKLNGIQFQANEIGTLNLKFNFLTKEITNKEKFIYHVVQRETLEGTIIGGETYEIRKHPRNLFYANPGDDKSGDKDTRILLSAESSQIRRINRTSINSSTLF